MAFKELAQGIQEVMSYPSIENETNMNFLKRENCTVTKGFDKVFAGLFKGDYVGCCR